MLFTRALSTRLLWLLTLVPLSYVSHCQSPLPYFYLYLLTQTRYVFHMLMCTSHPCSLQSLSLDCLNQMSKSLAQSKRIVKLTLESYSLSQTQDAKLFTRHLLLGLFGNNTLTDLTLVLPSHCWVYTLIWWCLLLHELFLTAVGHIFMVP